VLVTAERHGPAGQGYCQGGFSAEFTKVGEIFVGEFAKNLTSSHNQFVSVLTDVSCRSYSQSLFETGDTDVSALATVVCALQDGRVVLGGPGSFYWQGELTGV